MLSPIDRVTYRVSYYSRMTKRIKQEKRPSDINPLAHHLVDLSPQEPVDIPTMPTDAQVSVLMAELGRKGGKIGGKRRLETMTAQKRKKIARKAARTRWSKGKKRKSKYATGTK